MSRTIVFTNSQPQPFDCFTDLRSNQFIFRWSLIMLSVALFETET